MLRLHSRQQDVSLIAYLLQLYQLLLQLTFVEHGQLALLLGVALLLSCQPRFQCQLLLTQRIQGAFELLLLTRQLLAQQTHPLIVLAHLQFRAQIQVVLA